MDQKKPLFLQQAMGRQPDFGASMANNPLVMLGLGMIGGSASGDMGRGITSGAQMMQGAARRNAVMDAERQRMAMAKQKHGAAMAANASAQQKEQQRQELFLKMLANAPPEQRNALQLMGPKAAATQRYGQLTKVPDRPDYSFKELKDGSLARFDDRGNYEVVREPPSHEGAGAGIASGGVYGDPKKMADVASGLRKEFDGITKGFRTVSDAFNKAKEIEGDALEGNPQAQMGLVFSFMKMLDPGSTVREGEYAAAEDTRGLPQHVVVAYNKAVNGTSLDPKQVAGFLRTMGNTYKGAAVQFDRQHKRYGQLAKNYGLPENWVVLDRQREDPKKKKRQALQSKADTLIAKGLDPDRVRAALEKDMEGL